MSVLPHSAPAVAVAAGDPGHPQFGVTGTACNWAVIKWNCTGINAGSSRRTGSGFGYQRLTCRQALCPSLLFSGSGMSFGLRGDLGP